MAITGVEDDESIFEHAVGGQNQDSISTGTVRENPPPQKKNSTRLFQTSVDFWLVFDLELSTRSDLILVTLDDDFEPRLYKLVRNHKTKPENVSILGLLIGLI